MTLMICYATDDVADKKSGGFAPYWSQPATTFYLNHYYNYLYLSFIIKSTLDWQEKRQALKEMTICEKKLKYWSNHGNYNKDEAEKGISQLKKQWNVN